MTPSMSPSAYALSHCSASPLEGLPKQDDDYPNKKSPTQQQRRRRQQQVQIDDITRIYQSYAEMYPNPLLIRERLERDRLLQQIRQEIREEERLKEDRLDPPLKEKRSILSFLFGSSKPKLAQESAEDDNSDLREEDYLVYLTESGPDSQDDKLCGTKSFLDPTCIPFEAHAMARFHMSSPSTPIAVRRDPAHSILLVTAVGVISELVDDLWVVRNTSDIQRLEQRLGPNPDDFRKTRATCIGTDCLAIAWAGGREVLFYRRSSSSWDAVAFFLPTSAVIDHLESQSHVFESGELLRVTDVATLMVETAQGGMATTLVVTRLGGYLELVPIAKHIWRLPQTKRNRRASELFHINRDNSNIAPLTVSEHLDDLLHLEIYRTDVSFDTVWDADCENPPAEYLMVASGSKGGEERLTLWAVATVFPENAATVFTLHVMFLAEMTVGSNRCATFFSNQEIMENWRRPRRVERRLSTHEKHDQGSSNRCGTLSLTAPVMSMCVNLVDKRLLLSVLDWHGVVVIVDCSRALKQALQPIPIDQLSSSTADMLLIVVNHIEIHRFLKSRKVTDIAWSMRGELVLTTDTNELSVLQVTALPIGRLNSPLLSLPSWTTGSGKLVRKQEHLMLLLPRKSKLVATFVQPSAPAVLVTTTHKRRWEQTRQVDDLALVPDDLYVIEQVLSIFEGGCDMEGLEIASCIKACAVALERLSTIRVATAVQLKEETTTLKATLTRWSNRAGTYSLLCKHFGVKEDIFVFLGNFLHEPLLHLAIALAKKGDIEGLEILSARHSDNLSEHWLSLLENFPITFDASRLSRLLSHASESERSSWVISRTKHAQEALGVRPTNDKDILSYCLTLLDEAKVCTGNDAFLRIRESIGELVAIAKASRSSVPKSARMIRNRQYTMKLFLAFVEYVAFCCTRIRLLQSDARYFQEKLWQMYECLPESVAPNEHGDYEQLQITNRVDSVFRRLIATDILLNWSPQTAFSVLLNEDFSGSEIASKMCVLFCSEIAERRLFKLKSMRLRDLASDLVLLKTHICESSLDLESSIQEHLLMDLLQMGEFELFADVFSTELVYITDVERIQPLVLHFVNDIMLDDSNSTLHRKADEEQIVIQCQNALATLFPILHESFEEIRHRNDAAHLINSVLSPHARNLSAPELRDMLPFDVIEHVLRDNPLCILHGSHGWEERGFGVSRNRDLVSSYLRRNDPGESIAVPILPGDALAQLANLIGPGSMLDKFLVRSRVAHFAHQTSMPWIATALAIAMLIERNESVEENEVLISTIAQAVSDESDDVVALHAVLCREALRLSSSEGCKSIDTIIDVFGRLEHKISRFCPSSWVSGPGSPNDSQQDNQGHSDFLVFRAAGLLASTAKTMAHDIGAPAIARTALTHVLAPRPIDRVYKDTLAAYSADLNKLFQILHEKASYGLRDDPLLVAIGRFIMFWCISNSVRVIEYENAGPFAQTDAFENLALAASVFLHSRDIDAVASNVLEMKGIAEEQSVGAIGRVASFPRPNPIRPDLAIVRKLMDLGYSENGSRRAAMATNNESQQAALGWAVAHSLEPYFNAPIVFVKRPSPHVDQNAILDVKQCIHAIGLHVERSVVRFMVSSKDPARGDLKSRLIVRRPNIGAKTTAPQQVKNLATTGTLSNTKVTTSEPQIDQAGAVTKVETHEVRLKGNQVTSTKSMTQRRQEYGASTVEATPIAQVSSSGEGAESVPSPVLRRVPAPSSTPPPTSLPPVPHVDKTTMPPATPHTQVSSSFEDARFVSSPPMRRVPAPPPTPPPALPVKLPPMQGVNKTNPPTVSLYKPPPPPPPPKSLSSLTIDMTNIIPPPLPPVSRAFETSMADVASAAIIVPASSGRVPPPPPPPIHPRPPPAPRSAPPALDRLHLLKTGESIRASSRGISHRLNDEERRRLLNKGRELFQHVRTSNSSPTASSQLRSPRRLLGSSSLTTSPMSYQGRSLPQTPTETSMEPCVDTSVPSRLLITKSEAETERVSVLKPDDDNDTSADGWDFDDFDD